MSWSTELHIGELRPWPDTVHVVRGKTEETRRYVPERTCEMEYEGSWMSWHCKSCDMMSWGECGSKPRYCSWCGAKVVVE